MVSGSQFPVSVSRRVGMNGSSAACLTSGRDAIRQLKLPGMMQSNPVVNRGIYI